MNTEKMAPTKKSKFQPVLIDENQWLYDQIITLGTKACTAMPAVREAYEALRIGPWENKAYQAVLSKIHLLEQDQVKQAHAQYEALPFRSETVEREINESVQKQFAALRGAVDKLRSAAESKSMTQNIPTFPVDQIEIKSGQAVIPDNVKEEIRENFCRTYITNEPDMEVYNVFKTLEDVTNRILEAVRKRKPKAVFDLEYAYRNNTLLGLQEDKTVKIRMTAFKWLIQ